MRTSPAYLRRTSPLRHAIIAVACLAVAGVPLAAQRRPATLEGDHWLRRIESGDYIWSIAFPNADADLLGYGMGLVAGVRTGCPSFAALPEERWFAGSWMLAGFQRDGRVGPNLGASVLSIATAAAAKTAGTFDGKQLAELGCRSALTRRVMENALRMTTGRRPLHGGPAGGSTLVQEKMELVSGRHFTQRSMPVMQATPLRRQFMADVASLARRGFHVLECHYDADPSDTYSEVQYYWGGAMEYYAQLVGLLPTILKTAQQQLEESARRSSRFREPPRHPFLDYAYARSDCPSRRDAALPFKRIAALRRSNTSTASARADRTIVPTFTDVDGVWVRVDYGSVGDGFVPAISLDTLPGRTLKIRMEKASPFVLSGIDRGTFTELHSIPLRGRSYFESDSLMAAVYGDVNAVYAEGGNVLKCWYNTERQSTLAYGLLFWYKARPPSADRERLRARATDHPLLVVRAPQNTCPLTRDAARSIGFEGGETRAFALPPIQEPKDGQPKHVRPSPGLLELDYGSVAAVFMPGISLDTVPELTLVLTMQRNEQGLLWRIYRTAAGRSAGWLSSAESLLVRDRARLLVCQYTGPGPNGVLFWYKVRPSSAQPAQLAVLPIDHPLREVGPPRRDCPQTGEEARAALK